MLLRDDHKMTLSILMNVFIIDSITNTSASYRNFASCFRAEILYANTYAKSYMKNMKFYMANILKITIKALNYSYLKSRNSHYKS